LSLRLRTLFQRALSGSLGAFGLAGSTPLALDQIDVAIGALQGDRHSWLILKAEVNVGEVELMELTATAVAYTAVTGAILMAACYDDREKESLAIDDILAGMRRVIDQLPADERKLILSSMRSKWSDIADRLEAPSSRNH